jgi:hypothetical protein
MFLIEAFLEGFEVLNFLMISVAAFDERLSE